MAKFDYKRAKEEIAEINAIVETCPDAVKEKCFELLFGAVFDAKLAAETRSAKAPGSSKPKRPGGKARRTDKRSTEVQEEVAFECSRVRSPKWDQRRRYREALPPRP
jgi:hypothetical protein